jgi:hypothetical protein
VRIAKCSSQQEDPKQASAEKRDCADRKVYPQIILSHGGQTLGAGCGMVAVDDGRYLQRRKTGGLRCAFGVHSKNASLYVSFHKQQRQG